MSMLKNLKTGWKALTTVDKIKMGLDIICGIGGGAIGSLIGDTCSAGRGKLERAAIKVTSVGLGGAIGTAAAKSLNENVDTLIALNEMRKEAAARKKEGQENA